MAEPGEQDRATAVGHLSSGQLACLRLVMDGRTSKEIAKELGISPHTVDQRLRLSIQALGVRSRFDAARLVRQIENGAYQPPAYQPSQHPAYQAQAIVTPDATDLSPSMSGDGDDERGHGAQSFVGEARPDFEPLPMGFSLSSLSPVDRGKGRNNLAPVARIAWTICLMIGVVLALGVLVIAAEGLVRLLQAIRP